LSDDRRRADHDSVGVVDDQALAHFGPRGNLGARDNGAEVAQQHGKWAQVMQMEPPGSPVQQHGTETGMKQYHSQLREDTGPVAHQLVNVRPDVLKHDVSRPPRGVSGAYGFGSSWEFRL